MNMRRVFVLGGLCLATVTVPLALSAGLSSAAPRNAAANGVLYGALGADTSSSDLYRIDRNTGAATPIGPIGDAVSGLAFVNGTLYGVTTGNSAAHKHKLISIDTSTGAGTVIGSTCNNIGDLASRGGVLYGWCEDGDDLYTINTATGTATLVGESDTNSSGDAMSFDAKGRLYAAFRQVGDDGQVYRINPSTGTTTAIALLKGGLKKDSNRLSGGSFGCDGRTFYAIELRGRPAVQAALVTLDIARGAISVIGETVNPMDALVWKC